LLCSHSQSCIKVKNPDDKIYRNIKWHLLWIWEITLIETVFSLIAHRQCWHKNNCRIIRCDICKNYPFESNNIQCLPLILYLNWLLVKFIIYYITPTVHTHACARAHTHTKQRMAWIAILPALKALTLCHTTEGCHFVVTRWTSISHKLKWE
jgi:hypothetical protein